MIVYNPKNWLRFVFTIQRTDTLRRLMPLLIAITLYSVVVAWVELKYVKVNEHPWVKNIPTLHSLLGFAISILIVFRTNTAYDRWWEGRKHWGALVNVSRNLSLKLTGILNAEDAEDREFYRRIIPAYAKALRDHLLSEKTRLMLDEAAHPELEHLTDKHLPNQLARLMYERCLHLFRSGKITEAELLILNKDISQFTDICGACERIKNTPIPHSYSAFIRKFIFIYIVTLPLGYVFTLGYLVAPIVAIVFYVLGSMELVAEEIEDPFGLDPNDLPLDKIATNIEKHVGELL